MFPFPGGFLIAGLMIVNLIAAHAVRFKLAWKRAGIIMLHFGVIVLLLGEFATGLFAEEGLMRIDEGSRTSFVEDVRTVELAVVDPSGSDVDRVVTVPGEMVVAAARSGEPIRDWRLPFDVRVEAWMPNAQLVPGGETARVARGFAREVSAIERPTVRGVDGADADTPTARVTLIHDGEELARWLLSAQFIAHQPVEVDGETFGISLRFERRYLPYEIQLDDFRHDRFVGTNIARNFSSDVRLIDPARNVDRELRIWMNNPLRYQGRTFYQASYKPDGTGTVFQVVSNPGWLLPYIACGLVGVGLSWHFGQSLVGFLRRRASAQRSKAERAGIATGEAAGDRGGRQRSRFMLTGSMLAFGLIVATSGLWRDRTPMAPGVGTFAQLPVSAGGRVKPMDTAARNLLMTAGGRQTTERGGQRISATRYLLDLIAEPQRVIGDPVVRVDHPGVLALLELSPSDGGRLPLGAIEPHWRTIIEQAELADEIDPQERDAFQSAVIELHNRVATLLAHSQLFEPYVVVPLTPEERWRNFPQALGTASTPGSEPHPAVAAITRMMSAWSDGDIAAFEAETERYAELVRSAAPEMMRQARIEVLFNRASLFKGATAVYVLAILGLLGSFLLRAQASGGVWGERLRAGSVALVIAAVGVHTAAIAIRIYLQDRPPVTNLYSSAVFVGWASVLVGLFLERIYPLGVAALGSAVVGCSTLIVAHNLGSDGDTMEMMQAVLDSNFWLATHVITITLGYSATFLAGALGAIYLVASTFTRWLRRDRELALSRMVYGTVCFALLLSFVGTVLGGIWADQSWGRFWGWDPKENGAALVVLLTALILHARWGGMIGRRGVAVLAVLGNIVTAWSWFGTNMLGVGLHSYGFMDSAAMWLVVFVVLQLLVMSLGFAPHRSASTAAPASGQPRAES